jgi:hypothetical protein
MNTGLQGSCEMFGAASQNSAQVFYEYVLDFANHQRVPVQEVFGAVIAHELGHIVLGAGSHSSIGIMRPKWRQEDFEPARGALLFTRHQIKQMKALVTNRR